MASVRFQGETIPIPPAGTILLGRHSECQVRIVHDEASRRHARIIAGPTGITIEDLGSLNGTWVNGERTTGKHQLHDGDRITVCGFAVEFSNPPPAPAAAPTITRGHPGIASTAPAAASTAQVTMTTRAGESDGPPAAPPPPISAPSPSPPNLGAPISSTKRRAREADTIKMPGDLGTTAKIRQTNKSLKWIVILLATLVAGLGAGLVVVLALRAPAKPAASTSETTTEPPATSESVTTPEPTPAPEAAPK